MLPHLKGAGNAKQVSMRSPDRSKGRRVKYIIAIIKPFKLDAVREALLSLGISGLTASEVKGYGRQKGHSEIYRGTEYAINFLPKIKLEIIIPSHQVEATVSAIMQAAQTGQIGDGKIFVLGVENALRIRTGEKDEDAL